MSRRLLKLWNVTHDLRVRVAFLRERRTIAVYLVLEESELSAHRSNISRRSATTCRAAVSYLISIWQVSPLVAQQMGRFRRHDADGLDRIVDRTSSDDDTDSAFSFPDRNVEESIDRSINLVSSSTPSIFFSLETERRCCNQHASSHRRLCYPRPALLCRCKLIQQRRGAEHRSRYHAKRRVSQNNSRSALFSTPP